MSPPEALTKESFREGIELLRGQDRDLAQILDTHGPPPFWTREPGFPSLIYTILEQQVSLASAKAAFFRLLSAAFPLTPERFLELSDERLQSVGFSRQKTAYCRRLAREIADGELNLDELSELEDEKARARLLGVKGIGPWTADIYLLMSLRRPDIWPVGDMALVRAVRDVKGLDKRPSSERLVEIAEPWRPRRSVAARILWHFYLSRLRAQQEGKEPA
jgi:DNA-3-methyladenine glycosylase II